jgi:hypothetical protein
MPLLPSGYRILGFDPTLPIWIHSEISYELDQALYSVKSRTFSDSKHPIPIALDKWLREKHSGVDYIKLLKDYIPLPNEDPVYPFILYHMLEMPKIGFKLINESRVLEDHVRLWKPETGMQIADMDVTKIGKLSVPRSYVLPQYQNDPLVHKYFDFTDLSRL